MLGQHLISLIVATRDRPASLSRLVESATEARCLDEIIIVDDGSWPPVIRPEQLCVVIRNEESRLVSAARNVGASKAQGDVLVFVDDDCVLHETAVLALARRIIDGEHVGVAGPLVGYLSTPETTWCAGVVRSRLLQRTILRGNGQPLAMARQLPTPCHDFPSVFAVSRKCFEKAGGFDELRFPMHMEESDFASRARKAGFQVEFVADALVWHDLTPHDRFARKLHLTSPERAYLAGRSRGRFLRLHTPSRLVRAFGIGYWLIVLVPVYSFAILIDQAPAKHKIRTLVRFFSGTWAGLIK
jgi:GT2 family glycosyltransferase